MGVCEKPVTTLVPKNTKAVISKNSRSIDAAVDVEFEDKNLCPALFVGPPK